jgi:hypothetical protein
VITSPEHPESAREQPSADEVSTEELSRQQRVLPVESVDDVARPALFNSDWEWEEFLADLYASRHSDYRR